MNDGEDKITSWFADQSDAPADKFPIGIGDDMAQVTADKGSVLITTDMLLDGTHFDLSEAGFEQAGYKAMAASLSDCAAMATIPVCAVVAVALPVKTPPEALMDLHKGIVAAGSMFGCYLVGGDITAWAGDGRFAINVTMLSKPGGCLPVRRSGAKVGDIVCVTGTLGGAIKDKHLHFTPRVEEALRMTEIVTINSMMDISDGISTDLKRICDKSGVGVTLDGRDVPLSMAAMESDDPLGAAMNDGEDFELLFTLSPKGYGKLIDEWDLATPISNIGVIRKETGISMVMKDGSVVEVVPKGYDHL
ncbi:MAG: thiamine-phosphate kinase [Planctomycetes bacterium]|nr:thiamine-phosphate kinase [Planctomycetota bacterium]